MLIKFILNFHLLRIDIQVLSSKINLWILNHNLETIILPCKKKKEDEVFHLKNQITRLMMSMIRIISMTEMIIWIIWDQMIIPIDEIIKLTLWVATLLRIMWVNNLITCKETTLEGKVKDSLNINNQIKWIHFSNRHSIHHKNM